MKTFNFLLFNILLLLSVNVFAQDIMFQKHSVQNLRKLKTTKIIQNNKLEFSIDNEAETTTISYSEEYKPPFYEYVRNDSVTSILQNLTTIKAIYYFYYHFNTENKIDTIIEYAFYPQINIYDTSQIKFCYWTESINTFFIKTPKNLSTEQKNIYYHSNNRVDSIYSFSNFLDGKNINQAKLDSLALVAKYFNYYDESGRLIEKKIENQPTKTTYRNKYTLEQYEYSENQFIIKSKTNHLNIGSTSNNDDLIFYETIITLNEKELVSVTEHITWQKNSKRNFRKKEHYKEKYKYLFK